MNTELMYAISSNIIWIFIGYLIGSINFSLLITSKSKNKKKITELGSGNAGATNALRSYGWKFGLLIFLLDVSKSYWFTFIGASLQKFVPFFSGLYVQAITLAVILGHIFPIFFKFKGGKGAATNLGLICSISVLISIIGFIIFSLIIFLTRYVSVASFVSPFLIAPFTFVSQLNCWHDSYINSSLGGGSQLYWLSFLILIIAAIIVLWSHIPNIKKLIKGTENKIKFKK